jgi:hypothetical protein
VLKTFENESGKRKCKFISFDVLKSAIERLNEYTDEELPVELQDRMYTVGEIYTMLNRFIDFSEPNDNFVHFSWF